MLLSVKILTEQPLWFLVFCVLLGAAYTFVLYNKDAKFKETSIWLLRTMVVFRFLLVSILAFLLLSPFIKTVFNKVEKPIIILAQDNSSSILLNKDSNFYKTTYLKDLQQLKEDLEKNYEVKLFTFGDKVAEHGNINYSDKITNLSNLFNEMSNKFYNRNVGALILASDGIFNQGSNPIYTNNETNFPVYTIALGDTSAKKDIVLKEINYNKITFLGNKFPIAIYALAKQCKNTSTILTVTHKNKQIFKKEFKITSNKFVINKKLLFEAKEVGMQHYKIKFSTIKGEISTVNNSKDVYIQVLDGRQNILILANAPHPDIKAIAQSIESNKNYKVTIKYLNDFDFNLKPYNLVVIHQVPSNFSIYAKKLQQAKISSLYILGNQTDIQQFNALNTGLKIGNSRNKFNLILPVLANNFPLFTISEQTKKALKLFSPVLGPFGIYKTTKSSYTLLNQKIGSVATNNPLLIFFQNNDNKVAVLTGEGIWKWRMQEFAQNNNHNAFNELINKTVQFLAVKADKSKFRIITKNKFLENQEIRFKAELYNNSYELINTPEITLSLIDENANKYNFSFNKTANAYFLNAGILPVGNYKYRATVNFSDKKYTANGQFQIQAILLEANNTTANHQLLQNISKKFGGALFYPSNMNKIPEKIEKDNNIASIIYEEKDLKELINLKWIFFLLLSLLSAEWFIRKRNGAY